MRTVFSMSGSLGLVQVAHLREETKGWFRKRAVSANTSYEHDSLRFTLHSSEGFFSPYALAEARH